jgi:hypothetical protein
MSSKINIEKIVFDSSEIGLYLINIIESLNKLEIEMFTF